jgi:hypothetical protein
MPEIVALPCWARLTQRLWMAVSKPEGTPISGKKRAEWEKEFGALLKKLERFHV